MYSAMKINDIQPQAITWVTHWSIILKKRSHERKKKKKKEQQAFAQQKKPQKTKMTTYRMGENRFFLTMKLTRA